MKITLAILGLIAIGALLAASSGALTTVERAHAIQLLQDSQKEFLASVDGLTDEQWNYKPGLDRWSVGETAEHIVLAEGLLFSGVERALASPPNPDWETKTRGKTEFLEKVMVDRSHKAQAPEAIQPRQNWSRDETIQQYRRARGKTLKFPEPTQPPLTDHTPDPPFPVSPTLTAYQWLIYIPLHNMRNN